MEIQKFTFKTRYRVIEKECSNNEIKWTRYVPQYKHWYNLRWHSWYDAFYGCENCYTELKEAEARIKNEINIDTYKEKKIRIYNIEEL